MQKKLVIAWDFDHTMLNTERGLFGPVLKVVAEELGMAQEDVTRVFDAANARTFSWQNWFSALGVEKACVAAWERRFSTDVADRVEACLYSGVALLMQRLQVRYGDQLLQVLTTAGDPDYQKWKFDNAVSLHPYLTERFFVPFNGSKGRVIAKFNDDAARIIFIDDSPRWHADVQQHVPAAHIRPQWPDTAGTAPHDQDGKAWVVTTTIEELEAAIEAAIKEDA